MSSIKERYKSACQSERTTKWIKSSSQLNYDRCPIACRVRCEEAKAKKNIDDSIYSIVHAPPLPFSWNVCYAIYDFQWKITFSCELLHTILFVVRSIAVRVVQLCTCNFPICYSKKITDGGEWVTERSALNFLRRMKKKRLFERKWKGWNEKTQIKYVCRTKLCLALTLCVGTAYTFRIAIRPWPFL